MRNLILSLSFAALIGAGTMPAAAAVTAKPSPNTNEANAPLRAVSGELELLTEDFSDIPDGATDTTPGATCGRYITLLAGQSTGTYLDPNLTHGVQWLGNDLYAGTGGTIVMQPVSDGVGSWLFTPLNDYSGDITVKIRARWKRAYLQDSRGWYSNTGSTLTFQAYVGGYNKRVIAASDCDETTHPMGQEYRFYPKDGWVEVTYTLQNRSANSDGYLSLFTAQAVEIDWIKITDAGTYLASPNTYPAQNFTDDGFTVKWDNMRRAFNYYIDLYKRVFTAPAGIDKTFDFEDGKLPEGCECEGYSIDDAIGVDDSKALNIPNGSSFLTPDFGSMLKEAELQVKLKCSKSTNGKVVTEGLTADGNWEQVDVKAAVMMTHGYYMKVSLPESKIGGKYKRFRVSVVDISDPDDAKVYLDNVVLRADRPYRLVRINSKWNECGYADEQVENPQPYSYFGMSDYPSFTFSGLDPKEEYYYRINAHHLDDFAYGEITRAFGVATPQVSKVNINREGEYTAVWKPVAKADTYIAKNYEVTVLEEDTEAFQLLTEGFFAAEAKDGAEVQLNNNEEIDLDEYTDYPGWRGLKNTVGDQYIGFTNGGYLNTPPVQCIAGRETPWMYIQATGMPGDKVYVSLTQTPVGAYMDIDANGILSGNVILDNIKPGESVHFASLYGMPVQIHELEFTQDLKAGDKPLLYLSKQTLNADESSCTFSDLKEDGVYAFSVQASYTDAYSKITAVSNPSALYYIDIKSGAPLANILANVADEVVEVARYSIDGKLVGADYNGVVIVKMSDGSARKVLNK